LLIATRSEGDEPFGAVKLNKLLFYADFFAYVKFGECITGQEYQKLAQGPAPRRMLPVPPRRSQQPRGNATEAARRGALRTLAGIAGAID
jgi:hypothetical protein